MIKVSREMRKRLDADVQGLNKTPQADFETTTFTLGVRPDEAAQAIQTIDAQRDAIGMEAKIHVVEKAPGIVNGYLTPDAIKAIFNRGIHSKNLGTSLRAGDRLALIEADNFPPELAPFFKNILRPGESCTLEEFLSILKSKFGTVEENIKKTLADSMHFIVKDCGVEIDFKESIEATCDNSFDKSDIAFNAATNIAHFPVKGKYCASVHEFKSSAPQRIARLVNDHAEVTSDLGLSWPAIKALFVEKSPWEFKRIEPNVSLLESKGLIVFFEMEGSSDIYYVDTDYTNHAEVVAYFFSSEKVEKTNLRIREIDDGTTHIRGKKISDVYALINTDQKVGGPTIVYIKPKEAIATAATLDQSNTLNRVSDQDERTRGLVNTETALAVASDTFTLASSEQIMNCQIDKYLSESSIPQFMWGWKIVKNWAAWRLRKKFDDSGKTP